MAFTTDNLDSCRLQDIYWAEWEGHTIEGTAKEVLLTIDKDFIGKFDNDVRNEVQVMSVWPQWRPSGVVPRPIEEATKDAKDIFVPCYVRRYFIGEEMEVKVLELRLVTGGAHPLSGLTHHSDC